MAHHRKTGRVIVLEPRERIAVFLDIENFIYAARDPGLALAAVRRHLARLRDRAEIVAAVACCDGRLAEQVAFALREDGVRVFRHRGGKDAADAELVKRIRTEVPARATTVVIGSGDHIFAEVAAELGRRGKRVEVLAMTGAVSALLYRAAADCTLLARAN